MRPNSRGERPTRSANRRSNWRRLRAVVVRKSIDGRVAARGPQCCDCGIHRLRAGARGDVRHERLQRPLERHEARVGRRLRRHAIRGHPGPRSPDRLEVEDLSRQPILWNRQQPVQRSGHQPGADHRHPTGRHDGDGAVHLRDQQGAWLIDPPGVELLLHRIGEMQHDLGAPVGTNRFRRRLVGRRFIDAPQPLDDAAQPSRRPAFQKTHPPLTIRQAQSSGRAAVPLGDIRRRGLSPRRPLAAGDIRRRGLSPLVGHASHKRSLFSGLPREEWP